MTTGQTLYGVSDALFIPSTAFVWQRNFHEVRKGIWMPIVCLPVKQSFLRSLAESTEERTGGGLRMKSSGDLTEGSDSQGTMVTTVTDSCPVERSDPPNSPRAFRGEGKVAGEDQ